jgi:CheY-like chemotaxis protein
VDDQPDILQIIAFQLEYLLGATVDFASTGEIAIRKAERNQYDLIIADVNLPGMDGFELTSHLRQIGIKVPIILTSAAVLRDYRVRWRGADAFFQKPFSSDQLAVMVEELLRQGRTRLYRWGGGLVEAMGRANRGSVQGQDEASGRLGRSRKIVVPSFIDLTVILVILGMI